MIKNVLIEQEAEPSKDKPETKQEQPKQDKPKVKKPRRGRKKKKAEPGTIAIATGAVGSGRYKKFVGEAGARADKDAKGLMQDLGIKSGGSDLEGVLNVINAAIHTNPIMMQSYSGAASLQEQTPEGGMISVVGVTPTGIDNRNGIKFLSHTLSGAKNAGMLSLSGGVEINQGRNSPIIVYLI